MRHNYIKNDISGQHYAVAKNTACDEILIQIQDINSQSRISLTIDQANHMMQLMQDVIDKINARVT